MATTVEAPAVPVNGDSVHTEQPRRTGTESVARNQLHILARLLAASGDRQGALDVIRRGIPTGTCTASSLPLLYGIGRASRRDVQLAVVKQMRTIISAKQPASPELVEGKLLFALALIRTAQLSATDDEFAKTLLTEADEHLKQHQPSSETVAADVTFLRALVSFITGAPPHTTKAHVRACLASSRARHGGAWLLLACLLAQAGRVAEATDALESGLRQPGAAAWHSTLLRAKAQAHLSELERGAAQEALVRAVACAHDTAQAWFDLAEVYLGAGEREGAQGCLAKIHALGLPHTHALGSHVEAVLTARLHRAAGRAGAAAGGLRAEAVRAPQAPAVVAELGLLCACGDSMTVKLSVGCSPDACPLMAHAQLASARRALPHNAAVAAAFAEVSERLGQQSAAAAARLRACKLRARPPLVEWLHVELDAVLDVGGAPAVPER